MNLQNIQTHIGKENKCMVIKGKEEWEKNKLRYGMERYTLPYIKIIKWINKYLLHSTKNYVQYLVTIYNANELKNKTMKYKTNDFFKNEYFVIFPHPITSKQTMLPAYENNY